MLVIVPPACPSKAAIVLSAKPKSPATEAKLWRIVCGVTLGEYSFIGAGAVVRSDVPAYALMVGVPARRVGWMCQCGVRLQLQDGRASCAACGATYREQEGVLRQIDRPRDAG